MMNTTSKTVVWAAMKQWNSKSGHSFYIRILFIYSVCAHPVCLCGCVGVGGCMCALCLCLQ